MLGATREMRQYTGHGPTLAEGQKEKPPMSPLGPSQDERRAGQLSASILIRFGRPAPCM